MAQVLITGCDSGIGREFAQQCADAGDRVWATYLDLRNALPDARMQHHRLDVTRFEDFQTLRQALGTESIDLLVSNAGIGQDAAPLGHLDYDHVHRMLSVNLVGAIKLVETFADAVASSRERRIVFIGSRMGSITANLSGGHYGYRASKAGLNAVARSLAIDLFPRGVTVAVLHPGWVRTAGGSPHAAWSPAQSVQALRQTIARLGNHETGVFLQADGHPLPW